MRTVAVETLLALAVVSAWLGSVALVRFESALDRLHCVGFVNVACGLAITLAALVQDGISSRSSKAIAILAIQLIAGAATVHASGRALVLRDEAKR